MEVLPVSYMPGDPMLIDKIVCELKSQGIFDSFRKECIADVDTKPAYLNLRQRVEGSVTGFLRQQKWNPDMNKNQLREMLRKNIYESGFLETGVERIVDQVVNPKMNTVFLPKVTDVVYKYLGIHRPTHSNERRLERIGISMENLLPNDLEAVSPESDRMNDSGNADEFKMEEDESPPFEPIDEPAIVQEENSVDSNLSGFSGLLSHESNQSDGQRPLQIDMDTQMSKQSSDGQSVITEDQNSKMEICDDSRNDSNSKPFEGDSEKTLKPPVEDDGVKPLDTESVKTDCIQPLEGESVKPLEPDSDKSSSSVKEEKKEKEKKKDERDRDRHKSDKNRSRTDSRGDRKDDRKSDKKDKYKDKKDSKSRSDKDRHRSSSSKHNSSHEKSSSTSKKDSSSKHRSESKDDKSKERHKDKDSKSRDDKSKSSSSSKTDRHRKSSSSSSRRDKDKDKKDVKKHSKDDHYSSKHRSERRSTDRDSNDGSGLKSSSSSYCESNSSSQNSASQPTKPQDSSNSNSNDSGNSDATEQRVPVMLNAAGEISIPQPRRLIKPKIASNIHEARRLMKIRKQLRKIELDSLKSELSIKKEASIKREIPRPVTPPLSRSVSMASWDAMEAKLNRNVNYDSYYDPEFAEEINVKQAFDDAKVIKDDHRLNIQDTKHDGCQSNKIMEKGEDGFNIKESQIKQHNKIKPQQLKQGNEDIKDHQGDVHMKQYNKNIDCQMQKVDQTIQSGGDNEDCSSMKLRKLEDEEDCKYFSQISIAEDESKLKTFSEHLMALRKEIQDLEANIELSLCNNVPKSDARKVNKENKHVGLKRKSSGCDSFRKIRNNNNFIEATTPEEKFPLPLSPSDSDKSVERKIETETEKKHSIKSQRYASEELYKPRPVIKHSSRRRGGNLE